MTAKEFAEKNSDILLRKMTSDDFMELTDGCVLFCITVPKGNIPMEERQVRTAGYQMVAHTESEAETFDGIAHVNTVTLTANGYAKVDFISAESIKDPIGTKLLYFCRPLPKDDPRKNHHWLPARYEVD